MVDEAKPAGLSARMVGWRRMGLPADSLSGEALLALVARGDEEAFRALFRRYAGSFLALARRMGLDGAAAEDVVQEAMIRVWQKAKEFDPRRGSARAFLLTLGHHAAVDEVRRRAARPLPLEPDPEREEEAFDLPGPGLDEEGHLDRTRLGEHRRPHLVVAPGGGEPPRPPPGNPQNLGPKGPFQAQGGAP